MTTGKRPQTKRQTETAKGTTSRTPRSFGEQWRSKGDAFTRSVSQGRWTIKLPRGTPKQ
jgi:hypothetical protein